MVKTDGFELPRSSPRPASCRCWSGGAARCPARHAEGHRAGRAVHGDRRADHGTASAGGRWPGCWRRSRPRPSRPAPSPAGRLTGRVKLVGAARVAVGDGQRQRRGAGRRAGERRVLGGRAARACPSWSSSCSVTGCGPLSESLAALGEAMVFPTGGFGADRVDVRADVDRAVDRDAPGLGPAWQSIATATEVVGPGVDVERRRGARAARLAVGRRPRQRQRVAVRRRRCRR